MGRPLLLIVFLWTIIGFISCDNESTPSVNFDRGPLLENIGSNLIVASYDTLLKRAEKLNNSVALFTETPDQINLDAVREQWLKAYIAYQHCGFYNFGPADEFFLNASVNMYPTNKTKINSNISSGSYNLQTVSNNDAKGLPALDYLLFGLAQGDENLLAFYVSDAQAEGRKQYLLDVTNDIVTKVEQVFTKWSPAGGNYIGTFVLRTGNDVGGSTGMLLNAVIQYLERDLRDAKIGIPLGIRSLNIPIPNNSEALYAQRSIMLATESTKALQNIFLGKSQSDGIGFDDYLSAINARYNGGALHEAIQDQLTIAVERVALIPEPYSETVVNNPASASQAYQELQRLTILWKADMTSALGILITYQDNDGD